MAGNYDHGGEPKFPVADPKGCHILSFGYPLVELELALPADEVESDVRDAALHVGSAEAMLVEFVVEQVVDVVAELSWQGVEEAVDVMTFGGKCMG